MPSSDPGNLSDPLPGQPPSDVPTDQPDASPAPLDKTPEPLDKTPAPLDKTPAPLDKSGARVREMFRQIAPRYDAMNHLLSMNIDRLWRRAAVGRLRVDGTAPILDVCTGTGDLALAISRRYPDAPVVGSDFCFAMLQIAQQKAAAVRSPGRSASPSDTADAADEAAAAPVTFLEADAQALPFPDAAFQCVTVAFGLRNVADTDRGLAEMTRVCQPGGQVMVLEFSQPTLPVLKQVYGGYFRYVLPRIGQWFASNDKSAYKYLPESVGQFPSGQALLDRMRAAGLTDTRVRPLTFGVASIYEGRKPA